jgi:hypothetical protein
MHRWTRTAAWGTQSLLPLNLCAHMALVRLPPLRNTAADDAATSDHACTLQNWLYEQHRIEVPVKCVQVRHLPLALPWPPPAAPPPTRQACSVSWE